MVDISHHRGASQFHQPSRFLPRIRVVGTDRPWMWLSAALNAPIADTRFGVFRM